MSHGPLISAVDLGNFNSVYICTGQSGLDDKEALPREGVIVISSNFNKIISMGKMQIPRSMHRQAVICNRLFITGGSTYKQDKKIDIAITQCEEIDLGPNG